MESCRLRTLEDVCDVHYTSLISKIECATEDEMTELTEEILSCGYHGPVNVDKREEVIRAIVLHPILQLVLSYSPSCMMV
ncbi:hypothetical protein ILYODFUR_035384 [Ilyodon furcidens]|uniref:Uncharacterized protein n=1 Tax=Ilyodon furcidens TaxID=33524 RepID=A0ABV0SUE3_9TELE